MWLALPGRQLCCHLVMYIVQCRMYQQAVLHKPCLLQGSANRGVLFLSQSSRLCFDAMLQHSRQQPLFDLYPDRQCTVLCRSCQPRCALCTPCGRPTARAGKHRRRCSGFRDRCGVSLDAPARASPARNGDRTGAAGRRLCQGRQHGYVPR